MSHQIFPYHAPYALSANLWQVEGSFKLPLVKRTLPRNMTVWRAPDGRLVLYSVVAMHEEGMRNLEALGTPALVVVPHRRHHMDIPFYKNRYPRLRVLAEEKTPVRGVQIDGSVRELEDVGIRAERIPGASYQDIAMDVPIPGGRALCVCELLANIAPPRGVWTSIYKLAGPPGGGFGVSRVVRLREVVDAGLVRDWLAAQAGRADLLMLLVGHGPPLLNGVSSALSRAAAQV